MKVGEDNQRRIGSQRRKDFQVQVNTAMITYAIWQMSTSW